MGNWPMYHSAYVYFWGTGRFEYLPDSGTFIFGCNVLKSESSWINKKHVRIQRLTIWIAFLAEKKKKPRNCSWVVGMWVCKSPWPLNPHEMMSFHLCLKPPFNSKTLILWRKYRLRMPAQFLRRVNRCFHMTRAYLSSRDASVAAKSWSSCISQQQSDGSFKVSCAFKTFISECADRWMTYSLHCHVVRKWLNCECAPECWIACVDASIVDYLPALQLWRW